MRVFYLKNASWEIDFLVNDIFRGLCEVVFFNEVTPIFVDSDDIGNCLLVINDSYTFEKVEKLVRRIKPLAIFHLSDETGSKSDWLILSKSVKYYFRQYNHRNYRRDIYTNIIQIPCAYAPTFFGKTSSFGPISFSQCSFDFIDHLLPIRERTIDWSFIGTIKADRYEMTTKFLAAFPNGKSITGNNCWDAEKQIVSPTDMAGIYQNSIFVPVGRGNITLDCSRIYEAIICGAIPVVVAEDNEIDSTFWYNGHVPIFIRGLSWDAAITQCKYLMDHQKDLEIIQQSNINWWKRLISGYRNMIRDIKK
jgi:hypothetical protein